MLKHQYVRQTRNFLPWEEKESIYFIVCAINHCLTYELFWYVSLLRDCTFYHTVTEMLSRRQSKSKPRIGWKTLLKHRIIALRGQQISYSYSDPSCVCIIEGEVTTLMTPISSVHRGTLRCRYLIWNSEMKYRRKSTCSILWSDHIYASAQYHPSQYHGCYTPHYSLGNVLSIESTYRYQITNLWLVAGRTGDCAITILDYHGGTGGIYHVLLHSNTMLSLSPNFQSFRFISS